MQHLPNIFDHVGSILAMFYLTDAQPEIVLRILQKSLNSLKAAGKLLVENPLEGPN